MTESALDRARKQFEQAKARLAALEARQAAVDRKLETRRKVILGGALVELASRDPAAAAMLDRLVGALSRPQDKTPFEGWSLASSVKQAKPKSTPKPPPAEPAT